MREVLIPSLAHREELGAGLRTAEVWTCLEVAKEYIHLSGRGDSRGWGVGPVSKAVALEAQGPQFNPQ